MSCSSYIIDINGTHTDIALYIYRFMYRYTVLLYTTCTDGLYFSVQNCALLYNLTLPTYTHLWCTHCAWISCTDVHLYFSPVSVHSGTLLLCTQVHCSTAHSLVQAWHLFCQPITEEFQFTCFALIGTLGDLSHPPVAC